MCSLGSKTNLENGAINSIAVRTRRVTKLQRFVWNLFIGSFNLSVVMPNSQCSCSNIAARIYGVMVKI